MRTHLKQWRVKRGWTQQRMAQEIGLQKSHYNRIETGNLKNLRAHTMDKIHAVTRLPITKIEGYIPD